ncbi:Uncharacterised protein [Chlamydia abortus]|nr:Uncharacterised protein [Chlamydia abortus]
MCVFLIFRDFQFSRHIPGPSVCISHFSRFLVISNFQVVKWMFLIFHDFHSCHIPRPTVDISKFSTFFSFPRHISRPKKFSTFFSFPLVLQWTFLNFPPFSVFLDIFHVLKCVFHIFRDFQFSRHIPGPTVCECAFLIFHVFL